MNSQQGAEAGEGYAATSKGFRLLLQSALLGLGAWLAIQLELRNVTKLVTDHGGSLPGGRRAILSQVSCP